MRVLVCLSSAASGQVTKQWQEEWGYWPMLPLGKLAGEACKGMQASKTMAPVLTVDSGQLIADSHRFMHEGECKCLTYDIGGLPSVFGVELVQT